MRTVINISLPYQLSSIVEEEVAKGKYASKSEFFRHLLRLWAEGNLAKEIEKSREEFKAGKGKLLKSLSSFR